MKMYWDDVSETTVIQDVLDQDQVVLLEGDTVLGLTTKISQKGYEQLNSIKQRFDKPYLILIGSIQKIDYFVEQPLSEKVRKLIKICWPGPVTFIFKAKKELPHYMKSTNGTIALRLPHHAGLQKLLASYHGLFSTSANKHTEPVPELLSKVNPDVLALVDLVCLNTDKASEQEPSTIVDCSQEAISIIRKGAQSEKIIKIISKDALL